MNFGATRENISHGPARNAFGKMRVLACSMVAIALFAVFLAASPVPQSKAIIGGSVVSSAPSWVAFMAIESTRTDVQGKSKWCGGVLISNNLLLSARSCLEADERVKDVVIGSSDVNAGGDSRTSVKAWEPYDREDDLAVYQLSSPVTNTYIGLSDKGFRLNPQVVTLYGYGINEEIPKDPKKPLPAPDFKLRYVNGVPAGCPSGSQPTEAEFCLTSEKAGNSPCLGDAGGPIVASGKLTAIYFGGAQTDRSKKCLDAHWRAVSVATPRVRLWIDAMINKYHVHTGL